MGALPSVARQVYYTLRAGGGGGGAGGCNPIRAPPRL